MNTLVCLFMKVWSFSEVSLLDREPTIFTVSISRPPVGRKSFQRIKKTAHALELVILPLFAQMSEMVTACTYSEERTTQITSSTIYGNSISSRKSGHRLAVIKGSGRPLVVAIQLRTTIMPT